MVLKKNKILDSNQKIKIEDIMFFFKSNRGDSHNHFFSPQISSAKIDISLLDKCKTFDLISCVTVHHFFS